MQGGAVTNSVPGSEARKGWSVTALALAFGLGAALPGFALAGMLLLDLFNEKMLALVAFLAALGLTYAVCYYFTHRLHNDARHDIAHHLSGILAIATDAIIVTDEDQRILLFNRGAEQIFGYTKEEMLGASLDVLVPPGQRERHRAAFKAFARGNILSRLMSERGQVSGLRKGGEEFPAEASISKLETAGRPVLTVVLRDVTERRRAEQMLAQSTAELESRVTERTQALHEELVRREQMQAALVKAQRLEAIGQLTGGVAHDFNNLLTVVMQTCSYLLRRHPVGDADYPLLREISDHATTARELSEMLRAYARQQTFAREIFDVGDFLGQRQELIRRIVAKQAGRDLSIGDPRAVVWNAAGTRGYVAGMGSNNVIVIPNNKITSSIFINHALPGPWLMTEIDIVARHDADLDVIRKLAMEAAVEAANVLADPAPVFLVDPGMLPTHLQCKLIVPIANRLQQGPVRSAVRELLIKKFAAHDVPMPVGERLIGWP